MRKIALALALAITSLAGTAHAVNNKVAPKPGTLQKYIASAKMTPIKVSTAKSSQYVKFTQAMRSKPGAFRMLKIGVQGGDIGTLAFIPKVQIKGLSYNTAYIERQSFAGPRLVGKVKLPVF